MASAIAITPPGVASQDLRPPQCLTIPPAGTDR